MIDSPTRTQRRRFRPRLRGTRVAPAIAVLPTLLTLGNLLCGFAAIHYAAKPVAPSEFFGWSTLTVAGTLIFFGMFFDALDGGVARLTRSTSDLGAQLDSLSDMVTFGVAPAFMMLRLVSHYYGAEHGASILGPDADNFYAKATWTIAAVYICCTALRLARFNSETVSDDVTAHMWFRGLPSPGSAGCVASLILLHQHLLVKRYGGEFPLSIEATSSLMIPAITLLCALAMVSTIRYPHIINRGLRGRKPFPVLVQIVIPIVMGIWWLQVALAICFTTYAVYGPVAALSRRMRRPADAAPGGGARSGFTP
jgi:CDP-diacylglycerol--serine O-phosphatidyltransferase